MLHKANIKSAGKQTSKDLDRLTVGTGLGSRGGSILFPLFPWELHIDSHPVPRILGRDSHYMGNGMGYSHSLIS